MDDVDERPQLWFGTAAPDGEARSVDEILNEIREADSRPEFLDCHHEKPESWTSLIHLAQGDASARELMVSIAELGYVVYRAPAIGSQFVHRSAVDKVWKSLQDGTYKRSASGIVYSLTPARHEGAVSSLVVVFSSVAANRFTQLLDRHFYHSLPDLPRLVGGHTAVLRIADLDGVVGGYYLPTNSFPDGAQRVQALIDEVATSFGVDRARVVMFGASKGGTGALWHSITYGSHCVVVDPIITNNRRSSVDEPYFVSTRIFLKTFDEEFASLLSAKQEVDGKQRVVITSQGSAEYDDVIALARSHFGAGVRVIESLDPHIRRHNQVARNSVALSLGLINLLAQGVPLDLPLESPVL